MYGNNTFTTNIIVPFNPGIDNIAENKKYNFYLSTDIAKKANCEGVFTYEINLPSKNNNKYSIYVSETQLDNSNLRLDIDIK